ncbi:MAG: CAAX prenyl protease-related protein [Pseudomonadota bacterium]
MFKRAAWARTLPFLVYILFIFIADLLARAGWGAEQLRWLYPLKIGIVLALLVLLWPQYTELHRPRLAPAAALAALAAGVAVFWLWIHMADGWMVVGQSAGYDPRVQGQLAWPLVLVRWLGAALVVPVMEELFWRSFLMRWLERESFEEVDPAQLKFKSFIITVILFGIEHNLWLAGMVAGLVYALLYRRYGTLWAPILSHAVTNGVLGLWIILTGSWTYW